MRTNEAKKPKNAQEKSIFLGILDHILAQMGIEQIKQDLEGSLVLHLVCENDTLIG